MSDSTSSDKSSSVLILMKVLEPRSSSVNSPPVISGDAGAGGSLVTSVTENEPIGRMITVVSATDADGDAICTHLLPTGNMDGTFGIHEGTLTVARPLDYESQHKYDLTVVVTDGIDYTFANVSKHHLTIDLPVNRDKWFHTFSLCLNLLCHAM